MARMIRRRFLYLWLLLSYAGSLLLAGCGSGGSDIPGGGTVKFAVISDTHLYDGSSLGTAGPEFGALSVQENKLLAESVEILSAAITRLSTSAIDFVLVTGDLTKDGERINHELMASKLAGLKARGKKVFVVPGNHDINNPAAFSYTTSPPSPVDRVTAADFERIYAEFGFRDAIFRDPASLSYIVEPLPGIWLFALDSCLYAGNAGREFPTTSGAFGSSTRLWVIDRLKDARSRGKVVIGMMHHGILEHLSGQSSAYPEYVLNDWREVAGAFSGHGLQIVFTGHFHANDVTARDFNGAVLYDIETGSLVTYPNAYRVVEYSFSRSELSVQSEWVASIPSHPEGFALFSQKTSRNNLKDITGRMLSMPPYNLAEPALSSVSQMLVAGLMAHQAGNELPGFITMSSFQALADSSDQATRELGQTLSSLWTDLPPVDSRLTISVKR